MKHRVFFAASALCLSLSATPKVHAWQEESPPPENPLAGEFNTEPTPYAEVNIPTPREVYARLIALKDEEGYREGTPWDEENHAYAWNGGPVAGNVTRGIGCAAFAFELSDKAFGNLPARTLTAGSFQLSDVQAGDILRLLKNGHVVIVLQVADGGAIIAEGNYHVNGGIGMVHWERTLSKAEVESATYLVTRYPENYIPPDDPGANLEIDKGNLGANLTWKLTNAGAFTISGSGAMPDFAELAGRPWNAYMDKILTIKIEKGVTNVGSNAFHGCKALSATIPDSVTMIAENAFYESALVSVTIPGSVRIIGDNAFFGCKNLVSAIVSEGVETIGQSAFRACKSLSSIALPASVNSVGGSAFLECMEMTEAEFKHGDADKTVTMGSYMFGRCYKLSKVALPRKVDCIADGMFINCHCLVSLEIPQGAASIGESAFASCSLSSLYIPASVKAIGISAFPLPRTLNDVYFGGDEAAWNGIQKVPTVQAALSGATMHYNATPADTPSTGQPAKPPATTNPGDSSTERPATTNPGDPSTEQPATPPTTLPMPSELTTGQPTAPTEPADVPAAEEPATPPIAAMPEDTPTAEQPTTTPEAAPIPTPAPETTPATTNRPYIPDETLYEASSEHNGGAAASGKSHSSTKSTPSPTTDDTEIYSDPQQDNRPIGKVLVGSAAITGAGTAAFFTWKRRGRINFNFRR